MMGLVAGWANFAAAEAEFKLRMHQFLPLQANVPKNILQLWADRVEADSDGRIEIVHFPSMQLGGRAPELYDQAVDGIADIIWTVAGYTAGRFPRTEVFELPFMMRDAGATSRAFWQLSQKYMQDDDFKDTHMLAVWVHGPGIIHSRRPINAIDDLRGVKLRAPTRVTTMLFESLGAEPIAMPVPAVTESLSRGVIDAAVIPWEVTVALKVPELVKNHTEFSNASLYTNSFLFAMNKESYASLPPELQQVIDQNSGEEFSAFAGAQMQRDDVLSRKIAAEAGNNIITLTPDQVSVWRAAAQPTIDRWLKEMDDAGMDGTGLYDEARALIDSNQTGY
ncbi:MAG: TRAP transporter substrate-binding protein [Alphaproteobacteria bacterium]